MNLRTRIVSACSTAAIGLSLLASSAYAVDSTTQASLVANTPVGCSVAITSGTSINFGTFTWTGSAWTGTPAGGSISVVLNTDRTPGNRGCPAVQVQGTDLLNGDDVTAFPVSAISVGSVTSLLTTDQQAIAANPDVALGGVTTPLAVALDPTQVVNTAPVGVYNGTITFTVAAGS